MERPKPREGSGWKALFALALLANVVAAAYLVASIRSLGDRAGGVGPLPSPGAERVVRYVGDLPRSLQARLPPDFLPARPGETADVAFVRDPAGVPGRWFVPVVAWGTAVDDLTLEQLQALARGSVADWSEVGGLPGPPRFAAAVDDVELVSSWLGGDPERFEGYEALLGAMSPLSGRFALLPVEALRPSVVPLRVDGRDLLADAAAASDWPFVERWRVVPLTDRGRAALEAGAAALEASPPSAIRILVTGDILQTRCTLARIEALGDWRAPLATPLGAFLAAADLTIGSLDTSIQDFAEPYRCVPTTNLTAPPETLQALQVAGFDVLTVATNHTFDCGAAGGCGAAAFLRTLELVQAAGIRTVGGGRTLEEALAPVVLQLGALRVAILGFDDIAAGPPNENAATEVSPGVAPMDDSYEEERQLGYPAFYAPAELLGVERLRARVAAAKADAHLVVVLLQSGTEETHDPSPRSVKAARAAVDAGADLVVANQAHWVQAIEPRGGSFIAYALGNFIFDQQHTVEHQEGVLLEALVLGDRLAAVRLHPYRIEEQYRPTFVEGEERRKILDDITAATARLLAEGDSSQTGR